MFNNSLPELEEFPSYNNDYLPPSFSAVPPPPPSFPFTCQSEQNPALQKQFESINPYRDAEMVLFVKRSHDWEQQKIIVGWCMICEKGAHSFKELEICFLSHHKKYACYYQPCKTRFDTQEEARDHWVSEHAPHNQTPTYRCNCGELVADQATLDEHKLRHARFNNSINLLCYCNPCNHLTLSPYEYGNHFSNHCEFSIEHNAHFDVGTMLIPDEQLPHEVAKIREQKKQFLAMENNKVNEIRAKTEHFENNGSFNFA